MNKALTASKTGINKECVYAHFTLQTLNPKPEPHETFVQINCSKGSWKTNFQDNGFSHSVNVHYSYFFDVMTMILFMLHAPEDVLNKLE